MKTTEGLLEAFERIRHGLLNNDTDLLSRLVADDYRGFDPNGGKHDRAVLLQVYSPGGVQLHTYDTSEVTTRIVGDVGLVMGVGALSGRYDEHHFEHRLRFLDVYEYSGSDWLLLVSQVTEVTSGD